jgi:hypothetical protein
MEYCTKTVLVLLALSLSSASMWGDPNTGKLGDSCRSGKRKACEELVAIAMDYFLSYSPASSVAAASELSAQDLLAKVASGSRNPKVREQAIKGLQDQALLTGIALGDGDEEIRILATAKLTDQDVLARIASAKGTNEVRIQAIKGLQDQAALARIALQDSDDEIRNAAADRLTEDRKAKIAVEEKDPRLGKAAVGILRDQALLSMVAADAGNEDVREAAVDRLTDRTAIEKIAAGANDAGLRNFASKKLADQARFASLAVEDNDANVRKDAVGMLIDRSLLAKISTEDGDEGVREAARVALAILKTASLSVADRVKANWPLVRKGMSSKTLEKLIGPYPTPTCDKSASMTDRLTGRMTFMSWCWAETDLYLLRFETVGFPGTDGLTSWVLK